MFRVALLACQTLMSVAWPDGGVTEGIVLAEGTPVRAAVGGEVVRVYALDVPQLFADVPAGWLEPVETSEPTPF